MKRWQAYGFDQKVKTTAWHRQHANKRRHNERELDITYNEQHAQDSTRTAPSDTSVSGRQYAPMRVQAEAKRSLPVTSTEELEINAAAAAAAALETHLHVRN